MPAPVNSKQPAFIIAFTVLGVLLAAFFGMRAFHAFMKFNGHRPPPPFAVEQAETDVEFIRDWMTIPFISHTYHVPEKILFDALGISPISNHKKSLKDLNQEYYPDADGYVLDLVKKTILAHQPPPTPDSAPTAVAPPIAPVP